MIIECIGLPGAGKTTLVKKLTSLDSQIQSMDKMVSRRYTYLYIVLHPLITLWFMFLVVREGFVSHTVTLTRFKISLLGDLFGRVAFARQKKESIFLFDEGFLQRLLSVYETPQTQSVIARNVSKISNYIDRVVFVDTKRKFSDRYDNLHPRGRLGEEYKRSWEKIINENYKTLKGVLAQTDMGFYIYETDGAYNTLIEWIHKNNSHADNHANS